MKNFLKNWRTTATGIGSVALGVFLIVKGQILAGAASITNGFGLIGAKDYNVTGGSKPVDSENK